MALFSGAFTRECLPGAARRHKAGRWTTIKGAGRAAESGRHIAEVTKSWGNSHKIFSNFWKMQDFLDLGN
jgi:hypothetical protein